MTDITVLDKGKLRKAPASEGHDYEYVSPRDFYSYPANLVTGLGGVSGGRILIGSKATLQAISLTHRQAPLVQSVARKEDEPFVKQLGHNYLSQKAEEDGVVTEVTDHVIKTKSGKEEKTYDLYHNHNLGQKTFITYTPKVKPGDTVKKGDLLAISNYTDSHGVMAMGTNLRTAVMPYRSGNFEDAFVVTESGAKKLEAEQMMRLRMESRMGIEIDRKKYISIFPNKFLNAKLTTIDGNGVAKKGTILEYGDPIILALSPKALKSTDLAIGKLSSVLKHAFNDNAMTWDYESPGEVVDVSVSGDYVTVNVKTKRSLQVGDKLCITPDHEVLTQTGWKAVADVAVGESVYSINPATQDIEYATVTSTPVYENDGPMYQLETTQVSMCVTPNHKLYAQRRVSDPKGYDYQGVYQLLPAEKLFGKRYKLKTNGVWGGASPETVAIPGEENFQLGKMPDLVIPTAAYCRLLGWFLSEGSTFWHEPSGSYGFCITQLKEENFQAIRTTLSDAGVHYNYDGKDFRVYSKTLASHFRQFGLSFEKYIPEAIFEFSAADLRILYNALMLGDGNQTGTGHRYITSSATLADDFQRLCLLIGSSARVDRVTKEEINARPYTQIQAKHDMYYVYIYRSKNEPEINHSHRRAQEGQTEEWVQYKGSVHCLTLDKNHTFYIRRKGRSHWTGNSCVFGAKGVCGSIVPDTRAPMDKDGVPVDIILNSMSVTSRVAPSLITTLAMGKVAEKLGHPVKMEHFSNESSVEKAIDALKKHGLTDTESLYDPVTGRNIDVLTGPLYFTRLVHIAEDKESHRSAGVGYSWNGQPTKVEGESAKRLGNLGTAALLSHGATAVLRDIATIKATKNDEYWRRLKMGLPVPSPNVPFIFNKFLASLQGAGINVTKKDSKFQILPMTDKDVMRLSSGPIHEALTFQIKNEKLVPEKGGLFDPEKVGVLGEKYNHVELAQPVPNPVSEDFLRKLLGVTKDGYMEMIKAGTMAAKLKEIDLDKKLAEYTKYLKTGKKTKREDSLKLVTFLTALKKNNIHPVDLMLSKIPVIPAIYRPAMAQGDFSLAADVNYLYKDLLLTSNELKKDTSALPPHVVDGLKAKQYDAVKAVYGLGDPIVVKNQEKGLKGLLATTLGIRGGAAKGAMFQANVVNKPMDLVGRAVLTPSAFLDLDEASVPIDTLWKVYLPFVSRRLVQKGVPATKAQEYIETRNPLALEALYAELKERPAIISRDPSLHKFNLTGFFLRPNASKRDKTIKLNPLVFKGLAADNDGDQLNINVPASEEAKQEILDKMMPSRSLLSPKTFGPMFVPSNESALGLFQMSTEKGETPATLHTYKTNKDVVDAFHRGELHVGNRVKVG